MTSRSPSRLYVDSSAYLSILLDEPDGERLTRELDGARVLSSTLLVLEASRNLIRLARAGTLPPDRFDAAFHQIDRDVEELVLRDLTLDLCLGRTLPLVSVPRSLDLAHLRTALWFHQQEPLTRFVSLDRAQNQAARELGLPV